ncbi:MAG: YezD family protein [Candidatus Omnitrophota bacterium]
MDRVSVSMDNNKFKERTSVLPEKIEEEIFSAINRISFGEVVITIHDSRVVQIEKKEKTRFGK